MTVSLADIRRSSCLFHGYIPMRALILVTVSTISLLAAISNDASACGESLFRVGKGVRYQNYHAPVPGSVLVYARTGHERAVAQQLQEAGHHVRVVSNDDELAVEMKNHSFDVIIAPYSKREVVEKQSAQIAVHPDWVPVLERDSDDIRQAREHYSHTLSGGDDIRKYLKAIHRSLKSHGT